MSSRTSNIIEKILSQPIDKLKHSNKLPPNREALKLYRQILKFSARIDWTNQDGVPWRPIIIKSARDEFELARKEKDPVLIMKMILTSREAITKVQEKMNDKLFRMNTDIFMNRTDQRQAQFHNDFKNKLKQ